MFLFFACWGCAADDAAKPRDPLDATTFVEAACTWTDLWFDQGGQAALEEQRGFDAEGRPIWHTVDGGRAISWTYGADGRPAAMQIGDPLAPEEEHAYVWGDDGRLERAYVDGLEVAFTWSPDGLVERTVTDAGWVVEATRWTWIDGAVESWVLEEDGARVREAQRTTFEDGRSYIELQTDLRTGAWLEVLDTVRADGAPDIVKVTTDQGYVQQTWFREDDGWCLLAQWTTTGAELRTLEDQVLYRFDDQGREVLREVEGEGASPFVRRERRWTCDGPVQDAFVPPLRSEPSVFYVSPIYVDPPPP